MFRYFAIASVAWVLGASGIMSFGLSDSMRDGVVSHALRGTLAATALMLPVTLALAAFRLFWFRRKMRALRARFS
jgi:hypothetical protein